MNAIFKSPMFSEKAILGATYRTTGSIYYRIVAITEKSVRVEEMNSTGGIGKFANYSPALFEALFKNNCAWARYEWNENAGRYVDLGRAAATTLRLDRFLPTV